VHSGYVKFPPVWWRKDFGEISGEGFWAEAMFSRPNVMERYLHVI